MEEKSQRRHREVADFLAKAWAWSRVREKHI